VYRRYAARVWCCPTGFRDDRIEKIKKIPNAAIFGHSDYGVVGDVDKILPAVLEKLS
jgi:hypothetical protein